MANELVETKLTELADGIRREHEAVRDMMQAGLSHAFCAGEPLIEAKALVPHGDWLSWLTDNCAVSERTAQLYMRVARGSPGTG